MNTKLGGKAVLCLLDKTGKTSLLVLDNSILKYTYLLLLVHLA